MHVAVLGATGVLGRHVIPRLVEHGHAVRAVVRQAHQAAALERLGIEALVADILHAETLAPAVSGCDVAVHLATAVPRPGTPQDWRMNDRIRREGTRNLLTICVANGVGRYVQQSIALVYGDHGTALVDETTSVQPQPVSQSAIDMEALVRAAPLDWCIVRGGLFYGPGTGRDDAWRDAARAGTLRWSGDGERRLSLIHVADMAGAVVRAVAAAPARTTFNVVDDQPVSQRELYRHIAARVGGPEPGSGSESALPSLACTNARIRSDLDWSPAYPTYRSGLAT